ncbi:MAG: tyrosine-type recombinase/integrase [Nocardioidaceae bacterium]
MSGKRRRFGSVRRLPSGQYQASYAAPDGQRLTAPTTFARKAEAERFLSEVELNMHAGRWADPRRGQISVEQWAAQWMRSATHLKPKTRVSYESLVRRLIVPRLGRTPLSDLRPMRIREWVADLSRDGLSPSRIRQGYRLLSQMMTTAQLDGLIVTSPCVGVRLPRLPEHEPTILTPAEVDKLAGEMPSPYDVFTLTLAYTGARFGEVAALRVRYVDLDRGLVTIAASLSDANGHLSFQEPKSHQHRMVTIPVFLVELLRELLGERPGPDALVFTSPDGLPMRHGNFLRRVWQPACAAANLPGVTPHDLRASHASWLYDQGWSAVEIAARLGHSKATVTTKHYARRMVGRDVEIAAGLDALRADGSSHDVARGLHDGGSLPSDDSADGSESGV